MRNLTESIKSEAQGDSLNAVPRLQASRSEVVLQAFHEMIQEDQSLENQHDVKFLWHPKNLERVLAARPFEARPITMELDATLDCNYSCGFCTYLDWEKNTKERAGSRFMSAEQMDRVIHRMAEGGVQGVIFTGGGEPLMNVHTPMGLELAQKLGLKAGLFTNGSLLTSKLRKRLLASQPEFLRISANAVTPAIYRRFHGLQEDRFGVEVWENIERLASEIGDSETSFGLGVVVNHINVGDLLPLIGEAVNIVKGGGRIDYVAIRPVVNYGGQRQISQEIAESVEHAKREAINLAAGTSLQLHFAMEYFWRVAAAGAVPMPAPTATHCVGHPWMASVSYTGDVYLCSEGKGQAGNRIGNLINQTLDEIWRSTERETAMCSSCQRPPVCKAHRLTTRLEPVLAMGALTPAEIAEVQQGLDQIRATGAPNGREFL